MINGIIYKTINTINSKIYIGKTKNNKDDYYGSGVLLKRAIAKYGVKNFKKEIIDTASSLQQLNEKEKYWIKFYNSTNLEIGYNIGNGGDGGDIFTNHPNKEQIRLKCSKLLNKNGMFGRRHTKETIIKISNSKKGQRKGVPTWNKGKKLSKEHIEKSKNTRKNNIKIYKKYLIISPEGEQEIIYGLKEFCKNKMFSLYSAVFYANKKIKIPEPKRRHSVYRKNMTGFTIIKL